MAKVVTSMKFDKDDLDKLKQMATDHHTTVTDLLMRGLKSLDDKWILEEKVRQLESTITDMQSQGHKLKDVVRVSVPFSRKENEILRNAAHQARVSKSVYLRNRIMQARVLPVLPS